MPPLLNKMCRLPSQRLRRSAAELLSHNEKLQAENVRLRGNQAVLQDKVANDALTKLWTRHVAVEAINNVIAMAHRNNNKAIAFTLIDLDDFREINKRWGMAMGDLVLATIGELLKDAVRPTDRVIRVGGEEILIVAAEDHPDESLAYTNRIREIIAKQNFTLPHGVRLQNKWFFRAGSSPPATILLPDNRTIPEDTIFSSDTTIPEDSELLAGISFHITASMGIAHILLENCPDDTETFEPKDQNSFMGRVMACSDRGLRRAKNAGKNCCYTLTQR